MYYFSNILAIVLIILAIYFIIGKIYNTILISFVFLFNGFGLLEFFQFSGAFKAPDFGLVIILITFILLMRKKMPGNTNLFNTFFAKFIVLYTLFMFIIFFYTIYVQGQSIMQTFKIARYWIFFIAFFTALYLFLVFPKKEQILNFLLIITVAGAFLYILFNLFQPAFLRPFYHSIEQSITEEFSTETRVFGGLISGPLYLVAGTIFALLISKDKIQNRAFLWFSFVLLSLQPLLSWGRGYIVGYLILIGVVVLIARISIQKKVRFIIPFIIVSVLSLSIISYIKYEKTDTFSDLLIARLNQGKEDIEDNTGTFSTRVNAADERMKIIKEYPVFGAGFIHPDSGLFPEVDGIVGSGHQGFIQVLGNTGYLGLIFFIIFTLIIVIRCFNLMNKNIDTIYKAVAVATIGYIIQGYPHNLSTSSFVDAESMALMSISMAFVESGYIKYKIKQFNAKPVHSSD